MSDMYCSLCGEDTNRVVVVAKSADNKITDAWALCDECEKSLSEWAQSRARGVREEPRRFEFEKRCPFSHGGDFANYRGERREKVVVYPVNACTDDCALRINGKCSLRVMAEGMS